MALLPCALLAAAAAYAPSARLPVERIRAEGIAHRSASSPPLMQLRSDRQTADKDADDKQGPPSPFTLQQQRDGWDDVREAIIDAKTDRQPAYDLLKQKYDDVRETVDPALRMSKVLAAEALQVAAKASLSGAQVALDAAAKSGTKKRQKAAQKAASKPGAPLQLALTFGTLGSIFVLPIAFTLYITGMAPKMPDPSSLALPSVDQITLPKMPDPSSLALPSVEQITLPKLDNDMITSLLPPRSAPPPAAVSPAAPALPVAAPTPVRPTAPLPAKGAVAIIQESTRDESIASPTAQSTARAFTTPAATAPAATAPAATAPAATAPAVAPRAARSDGGARSPEKDSNQPPLITYAALGAVAVPSLLYARTLTPDAISNVSSTLSDAFQATATREVATVEGTEMAEPTAAAEPPADILAVPTPVAAASEAAAPAAPAPSPAAPSPISAAAASPSEAMLAQTVVEARKALAAPEVGAEWLQKYRQTLAGVERAVERQTAADAGSAAESIGVASRRDKASAPGRRRGRGGDDRAARLALSAATGAVVFLALRPGAAATVASMLPTIQGRVFTFMAALGGAVSSNMRLVLASILPILASIGTTGRAVAATVSAAAVALGSSACARAWVVVHSFLKGCVTAAAAVSQACAGLHQWALTLLAA